jgi:hypothetical protein
VTHAHITTQSRDQPALDVARTTLNPTSTNARSVTASSDVNNLLRGSESPIGRTTRFADMARAVTPRPSPTVERASRRGFSSMDEATLADARRQVEAEPTNPEPLFKLAGLLQRAGQTEEARGALTTLADVYERRGERAQADRVRRMLGTLPRAVLGAAASDVTRPVTATRAFKSRCLREFHV